MSVSRMHSRSWNSECIPDTQKTRLASALPSPGFYTSWSNNMHQTMSTRFHSPFYIPSKDGCDTWCSGCGRIIYDTLSFCRQAKKQERMPGKSVMFGLEMGRFNAD